MGVMLWEMMTNTKPWEGRFVDFNGLKAVRDPLRIMFVH